MNKTTKEYAIPLVMVLLLLAWVVPSEAAVYFQCPNTSNRPNPFNDRNGDGILRADEGEIHRPVSPNQVCMHLTGGDGFAYMADGEPQYLFGFANVTSDENGDIIPDDQIMAAGALAAEWPSPTIELKEGDEFWLTLTNVGMHIRPDLFDPHTVHYHGLPESSNIFDGLPESGLSIKMGASLTYFYKNNEPGTYMYHCHVEATEHMQMGMLGNLYVKPAQDGTLINGFDKFVYNDGDGSTGYDKAYPIQLGGFDMDFHNASWDVQPLPFATMWDEYPMINGRGYPDTTLGPEALPLPADANPVNGTSVQYVSSLVTATTGDRVLLRITNLNVTRFHTLASTIPMTVVGKDAKLLRGPGGADLAYTTSSLTLGGGESFDVILNTSGYSGTHFLYTTNLNLLSNDTEQYGGMMTEISITGP